jgi:hypothetical protein
MKHYMAVRQRPPDVRLGQRRRMDRRRSVLRRQRSLCIEEQFYLILPLFLTAGARWGLIGQLQSNNN